MTDGTTYAIDNLETMARNISAYGSYAVLSNDSKPDLYYRANRAERAILSFARWLRNNDKDNK